MAFLLELLRGREQSEMSLVATIDPSEYGIDLERDAPIATSESRVFQTPVLGDGSRRVLKVYDTNLSGNISPDTLRSYRYVTGKVSEVLSQQWGTLKGERGDLRFQWRVVPIDHAGVLLGHPHVAVAVSEYTPGVSLSDIVEQESFPMSVEGRIIQEFLFRTSEQLNRRLRSTAIFLSTWNTKLERDGENRVTFVVTDVCARVGALNDRSGSKR